MEVFIVHPLRGGMISNSASTSVPPGALTLVENGRYRVGLVGSDPSQGAAVSVAKRLGTTRYNATAYTGSTAFTMLEDFWRHGTGLAPTQKFVGHTGTSLVKDDLDGVWDELLASWGAATTDQNVCFAQGYAVFSTSNNDIPQIWNQTGATAALNGGGLPRFTAAIYDLRRLWTVGETSPLSGSANPSRSTVSVAGDITDFSAADATNFIFDEDDGDRLIAVAPFLKSRYYFKGPNRGSLHRVSGTTPTTFVKERMASGIIYGAVAFKSVIPTPNDIYWVSPVGIHSLSATQKYGDTQTAFLSYPIQDQFQGLNFARLNQIHGFYHPLYNILGWSIPTGSSTTNDSLFVYDLATGYWSVWYFSNFDVGAMMIARTPTTAIPRLYLGGYDGFVRAGDQTTLADDNQTYGYTLRVKTPNHLRLSQSATEIHEKQFYGVSAIVRPAGDYDLSLTVSVDGRSQTKMLDLAKGAGGLIGTTAIVGTWVIGDANATSLVDAVVGDRGRAISLEFTQPGVNENAELYGYALRYEPAEAMSMEPS